MERQRMVFTILGALLGACLAAGCGGKEGFENPYTNPDDGPPAGNPTVINSLMSYNAAIGDGANPAQEGTPGGDSGGAIYNDGNTFTLTISGTRIENNTANEGGGAIFFVSNDRTGTLIIEDSTLINNPSAGFETPGYPGIFVLADGDPRVSNSTIE